MRILPIILIIMIGVISSNVCAAVGEEVNSFARSSRWIAILDFLLRFEKLKDDGSFSTSSYR